MMIEIPIKITDGKEVFLSANQYEYRLLTHALEKDGKIRRNLIGHYFNLQGVFDHVRRLHIAELDCTSFAELIEAVNKYREEVKQTLLSVGLE